MSAIIQYGYQRASFKMYANFKYQSALSAILNYRHF